MDIKPSSTCVCLIIVTIELQSMKLSFSINLNYTLLPLLVQLIQLEILSYMIVY